MLAVRSHGSICARCAIRSRILALQQRRYGHSKSTSGLFRYYKSDDKSPNASRKRNARNSDDPESVIRRVSGHPSLRDWGLDDFSIDQKKEALFRETLHDRLKSVKEDVKNAPVLEQLAEDAREVDGNTRKKEDSFEKMWKNFVQKIYRTTNADDIFTGKTSKGGDKDAMWVDLRNAFRTGGKNALDERLKYSFYGHVTGARFTESDIRNQQTLADLRYPTEWYPSTRQMQRTIHLHVGPTNSGKTYHALQRLEQANSGVYAGPLRLLAHEVYTRMNAKGRNCALITGEERRLPEIEKSEGAQPEGVVGQLTSCTVEMMPLNTTLDVAVIDEIQMIGNADRGWAWTQALLGVKAKEVHLCGEERTVPLIQELCASVSEKLVIHRYERLSPLQMADRSLDGDLRQLRKGDCIVAFTVMGIHALRREIEKSTGKKVATVYGSLPPETRAQQARLFNDPDNDYDFLVASDAVGMGLNLAIKRIIFETSSKFNGVARQTLAIADIKQIAGRAGRYRTAAQANDAATSEQDVSAAKGEIAAQEALEQENRNRIDPEEPENLGIVTTLERFDFPIVRAAMGADPEPIRTAGLYPPGPILERFATYFPPGTPFSYILTRLHELSQMHTRFHLCGLKDQVWIADMIEPVPGLTISDRNIICSTPASRSDHELWAKLMPAYARCIATQSGGELHTIKELPLETLEMDVSASREYLRDLERLHKGVVGYLWLSYRFAGIFATRGLAFHVKELVEAKIEEVLSKFSFTEARRRQLAAKREEKMKRDLEMGQHNMAEQAAALQALQQRMSNPAENEQEKDEDDMDSDEAEASAEDKMAKLAGEQPGETLEQERPEEFDISKELDRAQPDPSHHPDDQTSLTGGGDHFGGEEEIPIEEPEEMEQQGNAADSSQEQPSETSDLLDDLISRQLEDAQKKQKESASKDA